MISKYQEILSYYGKAFNSYRQSSEKRLEVLQGYIAIDELEQQLAPQIGDAELSALVSETAETKEALVKTIERVNEQLRQIEESISILELLLDN